MTSKPTKPSQDTRAEEARDARVEAGADEVDERAFPKEVLDLDPEVAESYEDTAERGAKQRGEGRLP